MTMKNMTMTNDDDSDDYYDDNTQTIYMFEFRYRFKGQIYLHHHII